MVEDRIRELYPGKTFKNTKELCKFLGDDYKKGNSKIAIEKNWKRYFDWEKHGNACVIASVYDLPLDKIDGRGAGGHTLYADDIKTILVYYLTSQWNHDTGINALYISWSALNDVLCLVNKNFYDWCAWRDREQDIFLLFMEKGIKQYRKIVQWRLKGYIKTALNKLADKKYLDWAEVIVYEDMEKVQHIATDAEKIRYNELYNDTIREFGVDREIVVVDTEWGDVRKKEKVPYTKYWDIINAGFETQFYQKLNHKCRNELGWHWYTQYCKITTSKKLLQYADEDIKRRAAHSGYTLNEKLCEKITKWSQMEKINMVYPGTVQFLTDELIRLNMRDNDDIFIEYKKEQFVKKSATVKNGTIHYTNS